MQSEVDSIKVNILPFTIIGIIGGSVLALSDRLIKNEYTSAYLTYAKINIDFSKHAESIFYEHFAPLSLSYLLIILFTSCALHRLLAGAVESKHNGLGVKIILPMRNFAISLATAFLGLMLGIAIPALFADGWPMAIRFLVLSIYPISYIILFKMVTVIIYHQGIHSKSEWIDENYNFNLGTRIEGLIILILSFTMLTYHSKYIEIQDWLSNQILNIF